MNKFVTIGDEKISITEIENAKSIPELLQTRVQYAILDQLNDINKRFVIFVLRLKKSIPNFKSGKILKFQ